MRLTAERVIALVADEFGLMHNELRSDRRSRTTAAARFLAEWLARKLTTHSVNEIARAFGNRDHTTILYGIRQAEFRLKHDVTYRRRCMNVLARIEARG